MLKWSSFSLESKYSFSYSNIVKVPKDKTTTYDKNSFKYTAAIIWNDLPDAFWKIEEKNSIVITRPFYK
jgi:hypothetical protein